MWQCPTEPQGLPSSHPGWQTKQDTRDASSATLLDRPGQRGHMEKSTQPFPPRHKVDDTVVAPPHSSVPPGPHQRSPPCPWSWPSPLTHTERHERSENFKAPSFGVAHQRNSNELVFCDKTYRTIFSPFKFHGHLIWTKVTKNIFLKNSI